MKKILKDKWLLIFLLLGLILRISLTPTIGFKIDIDAWYAWALRLASGGFGSFYSDNVWTNYTPGYLYILKLLGSLQSLFHWNSEVFYMVLKIPPIITDLLLASLVYKIIAIKNPVSKARLGAILIIFNPALIFNSTIWGQIDSVLTLAILASVYYLDNKRIILSSIFLGIALLIKPQAVLIAPLFLFFLVKHLAVKNFFKLAFPSILILIVFSIPFFGWQSLQKLFELFLKMTGDYPYTSLFAYNFWGGVGFWVKDNQTWFNLTYQYLGYLMYFSFWIIIGYLHFFRKNLSIYILATFAALSFYFLPTRVHERYLYPALPFLIILIMQFKSSILSLCTYYLSFIYLLNLYYVYMYYNYHYLYLPTVFYSSSLYNLLDTYGKQLSIFSTLIFILISTTLIRLNNVKKESF